MADRRLTKSSMKVLWRAQFGNLSARTFEDDLSRAREELREELGKGREELRQESDDDLDQAIDRLEKAVAHRQ